MGNADGAYDTLRRVLPTNPDNPVEHSGPPPFWKHNAWFGDQTHPSFGRTSGTRGTGTVAWGMLIAAGHILGVCATTDGLVLTPKLPVGWNRVRVEREVRGCRYEVEIHADLSPKCEPQLSVDGVGVDIAGGLQPTVPWCEADRCSVLLRLPRNPEA